MKAKQLIPFVVLLLVFGGLALLKISKQEKPSIVKQANLSALLPEDIKKDAVTRVDLYAGADKETRVSLAKSGDAWAVASSFNAPVLKDTMDKYLDMLLALKGEARDTAAEESKLAVYELKDDQAFHVEVYAGADTPAFHLLVGKAPDSRSVFLRTADGKDIYVESKDPRKEAGVTAAGEEGKPTPTHWFDKDIIKIEQERIKGINLTMPDKSLALARVEKTPEPAAETPADGAESAETPAPETPETPAAPEYTWQLSSGGEGYILKEPGVDSMLQKIATFVATDIVDPAKKADWGLETPAFRAEIALEGDENIVLEAGRPDPAGDAYVRVASSGKDIVYQVNKFNFERLFAKGNQLFDLPKQIIPQESISAITINGPDGEISLQKDGEWKLLTPQSGLELQTSTVNSLVSTLAALSPNDYADAATDIGGVTRTISVTAGDQTHVLRIAGANKSGDGSYLQLGDNPAKLAISQNDFTKLALKPADFFVKKVNSIAVGEVVKVDIQHDGATFAIGKSGEGWDKQDADGTRYPAETLQVDNMVYGLDEAQISDVANGVDPATLAFNTIVNITYADGSTYNVSLTALQDAQYYMTCSAHASVFKIDSAALAGFMGAMLSLRDAKAPEATATPDAPANMEAPAMMLAPGATAAPAPVLGVEQPLAAPPAETPTIQIDAPVEITAPQN